MRKLIEFIRSIYVAVLFVVLEAVAIGCYAHSSSYNQARLLARSNQVAGGGHGLFAGIRRDPFLGRENRDLADRVARLEEQLAQYQEAETAARLDSYMQDIGESRYHFATAVVVGNTLNRMQNLLPLNRGRKDGIEEEMAILAPDGAMVGYVVACTERYSVAMSVLNTSFRTSGKIADTDYSGSIYWDGTDPSTVTLGELSKYAEPKPGQEVVTAGLSEYFPADVLIGWVESAELNETKTSYTVRVRLAAEMSRLNEVILVADRDRYEIRELQQSDQVEQHTRLN